MFFLARGRKNDTIKRITKRQGETIKALGRTGVMTSQNAEKYFALNYNNARKMERNGYIKIEKMYIPKVGLKEVYKLNSKGKTWVKNEQNMQALYRTNNKQISHDLKLNQFYCQLKPEQRDTWLNENEIIKNWNNLSQKAERIGTVDAMVLVDDIRIAVEVVTNNYGEEEMQLKEEVARDLQCDRMVVIKA